MVCSKRLQISRPIGGFIIAYFCFMGKREIAGSFFCMYSLSMQEFLIGLACGIAVAIIAAVYFSARLSREKKAAKAEIEKYKNMLTDRMELEAEGVRKTKEENEKLRKENENLRVSLMAMREKPGRKELQRLQVMQTAAERLTLNSPGFAPVWQAALQESEEEFRKMYSGVIPFMKKHVPLRNSDAQLIEDSSDE